MSRILVYEKNIFMRDTLRIILQGRIPGLILEDVASIKECMEVLPAFQPDIVLLNISYHSGDDMDRLRQIRELVPSAVILMLMDYDIDEYRQQAIVQGADYIISKDLWTGKEILSLVGSILETRGRMGHLLLETASNGGNSSGRFNAKQKGDRSPVISKKSPTETE